MHDVPKNVSNYYWYSKQPDFHAMGVSAIHRLMYLILWNIITTNQPTNMKIEIKLLALFINLLRELCIGDIVSLHRLIESK